MTKSDTYRISYIEIIDRNVPYPHRDPEPLN